MFDDVLKKKKAKIERLEKNHARLIHILENLKGRKAEANLPKLTVISGRDNIYDQIKKIIDETEDKFYVLLNFIYESYYINEKVWELIGYEPYPTMSAGPKMKPFDEAMLERVKQMSSIYFKV